MRLPDRRLLMSTALVLWTLANPFAIAQAAGGELKVGRYVGFIRLDDTGARLALVANTFIVQPEDFTQFPRLNATFRMSLGGYATPEYVAETFEDIRYDFNDGRLTLDEPANDLVMTAEVDESGSDTKITGQVWIRSAAKSGTLYLEYESDEPGSDGDGDGDDGSGAPFIPALAGQYEGTCGGQRAALQITTGKQLARDQSATQGLRDYAIVGRLALDQPDVCGTVRPTGPSWCVLRNFRSGSYDFFSGRVTLDSPSGSTSCTLNDGKLTCPIRIVDQTLTCELTRTDLYVKPYEVHERLFTVRTTADQRAALPDPAPPLHADLMQALRGQFFGYLHNEANDRYQPLKLVVIPSVSTVNPHDENRIFISPNVVTYFGRGASREMWPQPMDRRAFYLRPGFTLEGSRTDGFLQIEEWRKGYVKGVWFSHAYGRVGTVQLVKGDAFPPLDAAAKVVGSISGDYEGYPAGLIAGDIRWWFRTIFPAQPVGREQSTFSFEGDARLGAGLARPVRLERGSYDTYTGAVALFTAEDSPRMIVGKVTDTGDLALYWPGAAIWGVGMADYGFSKFPKIAD